MKYPDEFINKVILGDSREVLTDIPDKSMDLIATDPQYGWNFMSKVWDRVLPHQEIYNECFRVLKDGAFIFWMSGARFDGLIENGIRLRNAGFRINFSPIYWTYSSGFPKAMNISKNIDKRGVVHLDDSDNVPYSEEAKEFNGSYAGFQPKPAVEVVIVAMKPLSEKTYVEQALKNGKGITWLDDGRIPILNCKDKESYDFNRRGYHERANSESKHPFEGGWKPKNVEVSESKGRFPANLLVEDDVLNDGKITKSSGGGGLTKYGSHNRSNENKIKYPKNVGFDDIGSFSRYFNLDAWFEEQMKQLPREVQKTFPFFIVPKASRSEKNRGLNDIKPKYLDSNRKVGSAGGCNPRNRGAEKPQKNYHPTIKPIKLFSYLIIVGSRKGDIILDPFLGSGTTAVAARMLNRNFIGIEIDTENYQISEARIKEGMRQEKL